MNKITKEYNETELTEIFEIARLALGDSSFLADLAESCDLSEDYLCDLRDKLNKTMLED